MLSCQKHLFSLPSDVHYFNAASLSPSPSAVEAAGLEALRRKSQPHRLQSLDWFTDADRAKSLFAQLIHGTDPARIALIPAVSYGMATVANNLKIKPGLRENQRILLIGEEYPSDVYAWEDVCRERNLTTLTIAAPAGGEGRGSRWNRAILEAIDETVCLVVVPPLHWTDGTLFDLKTIREQATAVGAWLAVDATQTIGAYPFNVEAIQPDALVCAGYKWLLGGYGLGFAYFGPAFDGGQPIEQNWINRANSDDFSRLIDYQTEYRPGAARYSAGEHSNFILLPMLITALQQLLTWTPEDVQIYCRELVAPFVSQWEKLGFRLEDEAFRASHLFGLRPPVGTNLATLRQELTRRQVYVSVRGDAIRVSPHVYNDARDLEALTEALRAVVN